MTTKTAMELVFQGRPPPDVKLEDCRNCKWCGPSKHGEQFDNCDHPQMITIVKVLIGPWAAASPCGTHRRHFDQIPTCGPAARLFEPKPEPKPRWKFWQRK